MQRISLDMVVTASGGATQGFNTSSIANGLLQAITYRRATASGLSTAGHITITGAISGLELLSVTTTGAAGVTVTYYPRAAAQDTSGVTLGFTSAATPPMIPQMIPVDEALRAVVSSGGTGSGGGVMGTLNFYVQR